MFHKLNKAVVAAGGSINGQASGMNCSHILFILSVAAAVDDFVSITLTQTGRPSTQIANNIPAILLSDISDEEAGLSRRLQANIVAAGGGTEVVFGFALKVGAIYGRVNNPQLDITFQSTAGKTVGIYIVDEVNEKANVIRYTLFNTLSKAFKYAYKIYAFTSATDFATPATNSINALVTCLRGSYSSDLFGLLGGTFVLGEIEDATASTVALVYKNSLGAAEDVSINLSGVSTATVGLIALEVEKDAVTVAQAQNSVKAIAAAAESAS